MNARKTEALIITDRNNTNKTLFVEQRKPEPKRRSLTKQQGAGYSFFKAAWNPADSIASCYFLR